MLIATAFAGTLSDFEQQLEAHKGKVVYLDFWASWCVPCRRSFPWMNKLQTQYKDQGLVVFSVNLDADKTFATQFLTEVPANFYIFYDPKGEVAKALKVRGMPSSYLIDRSGNIVSSHVGFNDKKQIEYQAEIERLLAD
ncbi:TlpA family protein disulfide reductase [Thalassotalea piscium]|uniref:Thiol-disulfide isomerase/thioredoxin n=1 Tax=Thalassotalea piscium TaxID=1230533 RepID=A0A7X0NI42_9GAMM|nr:TlpA disulfide reductase family protein [Thalassotalea piscium]MBB6543806.1 thiol-disulfide isomerase/thioredoxin [Thalassotalea piscium]